MTIDHVVRHEAPALAHGQAPAPVFDLHFDVFGAKARITVLTAQPAVLEEARARLEDLQRLWSEEPASDLSRLARAGGPVEVAYDTLLLLSLASSSGLIAPIELNLPDGTAFAADFRGMGLPSFARALAADLVMADLLDAGVRGARVAIGEACRVEGTAPLGVMAPSRDSMREAGWFLPVPHPVGHFAPACLFVRSGAVVTVASTAAETQTPSGAETRRSVEGRAPSPAGAVVISRQAWHAYILAEAGVRMSVADGRKLLESAGASGLLLCAGGAEALRIGEWDSYLG